ncbi:MAG: hypothetical protein HRU20_11645 [Pseudomonadales bacterium]|nr:hypothetical protein [Pseudomonadales bacterium]
MKEFIKHIFLSHSKTAELRHLFYVFLISLSGCAHQVPPDAPIGSDKSLSELQLFIKNIPEDPYWLQDYPDLDRQSQEQFQQALQLIEDAKPAAAKRLLIKLSKNQPDLSAPYFQLGMIERQLGQNTQAYQQTRKAIAANPYNYPAYMLLAELLQQEGKFIQAEQSYLDLLIQWPGFAEAYYHLARLQELYLAKPQDAYSNYEIYLLLHGEDKVITAWMAGLKRQIQ